MSRDKDKFTGSYNSYKHIAARLKSVKPKKKRNSNSNPMQEHGIEYSDEYGEKVCLVEAKYLSDLSTKTERCPIRNQMDRVIENLLVLRDKDTKVLPSETVFTLLTPRLFKEVSASRMYGYRIAEYGSKMISAPSEIAKRIELIDDLDEKREVFKELSGEEFFLERMKSLKIKWVTFEDIFEQSVPNII